MAKAQQPTRLGGTARHTMTPTINVRDEEAVGSNPATPTQVRAQIQASDWALFMASTALWYSNSVTAQLSAKPLERIAGDRCRDVGVRTAIASMLISASQSSMRPNTYTTAESPCVARN
jgi:hypothetical protein